MPARPDSRPDGRFRLAKHYVDGVDADGNAFIAYSGEVRWRRLAVPLCGISLFPASGRETTHWHVGAAAVREDPGLFGLSGGGWEIEAEAHRPAFGARLSDGVEWSCLVQGGPVRMRGAGDRLQAGLQGDGYAERLELSVAPWNLPLEALVWGRFVNPDESLTWIEWRGAEPLRRAWWNGRSCEVSALSSARIEIVDGPRLEIAGERVLRDGPVAGLLTGIRPLAALLPSLARMRETRRLGRGTLTVDGRTHTGWVIHEEVVLR